MNDKRIIDINDLKGNYATGGAGTKIVANLPLGPTYEKILVYTGTNGVAATAQGFAKSIYSQIELQINGSTVRTWYPQMMSNWASTGVSTRSEYVNNEVPSDYPVTTSYFGFNNNNLFTLNFAEFWRTFEAEIYGPVLGTADPALKSVQLVFTLAALPGASTARNLKVIALTDNRPQLVGTIRQNVVTFPTTVSGNNTVELILPPTPQGKILRLAKAALIPNTSGYTFSNVLLKSGTQQLSDYIAPGTLLDINVGAQMQFAGGQPDSNEAILFVESRPPSVTMQFDALSIANCLVISNPNKFFIQANQSGAGVVTLVGDFYAPVF